MDPILFVYAFLGQYIQSYDKVIYWPKTNLTLCSTQTHSSPTDSTNNCCSRQLRRIHQFEHGLLCNQHRTLTYLQFQLKHVLYCRFQ